LIFIEKAIEAAAATKEMIITGEKLAEENLHAAKEIIKGFFVEKKKSFRFKRNLFFCLEKTNELIENAKQVAHDVSEKAQEIEKSAEHNLAEAEKIGRNFLIFYSL
jgi:dGTP triphosphohydrolase